MEKTVVITIHADPDYDYEVCVGEEIYIASIGGNAKQILYFSSLEEMENVAKAMLSAVKCCQNI